MTHFTVLVAGEDYESILAPYDENIKVAPYISKTKDEVEAEFLEYKSRCQGRLDAGGVLSAFDQLTLYLDHVTRGWWNDCHGNDLDSEMNAISTYNPKSKWDWYVVGGRWTGMFILNPGTMGELGRPGVFGNKPQHDADIVRLGDVDWKSMNAKARERVGADWDKLFAPIDPKTCWLKPEYVEQQKALHLEMYGTKEEYLRRRGFWTTYALVTESEWIAPGDMGWWGFSSDYTKDRDAFDKKFVETLKSMSPDTIITCVDCHI